MSEVSLSVCECRHLHDGCEGNGSDMNVFRPCQIQPIIIFWLVWKKTFDWPNLKIAAKGEIFFDEIQT